jgi:hypothetical protein
MYTHFQKHTLTTANAALMQEFYNNGGGIKRCDTRVAKNSKTFGKISGFAQGEKWFR